MSLIDDLAARLKQPLPGAEAQLKMSPTSAKASARPLVRNAPADVRQAAALILLIPEHASERRPGLQPRLDGGAEAPPYTIVLTERRHDLIHHPGQISLPGGGIDEGETAQAASLREAEEEIGVDPSSVRVLGSLTPLYVIVSGFVITPFVGVVESRPVFRPEAREVAEILEAPLGELLDPSRRRWGNRTREGLVIDFPYFALGNPPEHQVWGATAMILSEFVQLFR
ncbi:MAG: CoA pyrophosphatase [Acidobacteria bacterium]|nr:MAG: CoA pyrophosphatase [Acidobacteriota bacterium]